MNLPPEIGLLASVLGGSAWQDDADRRQKAGGDSITGGPTQPSGAPARQGMAQVLAKQSAPSTYQGYTPAEARQIDALANRVLAATKSKLPDQLQQLQALRGLAPGADPRIVNGVRRKILGLLDGTDEAERVAPRYSQVGSFLDPANHGRPLTRQELARLVA